MLMGNFVRRGAFIECRDKDKDTPLLIAASKNHLGTIKTLLNHGADIGAKDSNDETPIYRAASEGCIEALEVRCFVLLLLFLLIFLFFSIYDVAVVMIPLTQRFFPPSYCSFPLPSAIPFFFFVRSCLSCWCLCIFVHSFLRKNYISNHSIMCNWQHGDRAAVQMKFCIPE